MSGTTWGYVRDNSDYVRDNSGHKGPRISRGFYKKFCYCRNTSKKVKWSYQNQGGMTMKKKNFRKLFAVLIAACMMVLCVPVTSQAAVRVSAPRLKTARSTSSGMYLNWTRISNASGYVIYRNNKCIGGVKGSRSLAYLDKKAKTGSRYTYSVRAFRQYDAKATVLTRPSSNPFIMIR